MRSWPRAVARLSACFVPLAFYACSSDTSSAGGASTDGGEAFAPPDDCARTGCEQDQETCEAPFLRQKSDCKVLCGTSISAGICVGECEEAPLSGISECEGAFDACQMTARNSLCLCSPAPGPTPTPPGNRFMRGSCTDDEITSIANEADSDSSTLIQAIQATSNTCQACVLTKSTDPQWGSFVQFDVPPVLVLNEGACVEGFGSSCGPATSTYLLCSVRECCDGSDDSSCGCDSVMPDAACLAERGALGLTEDCFPLNGVQASAANETMRVQCGNGE